MSFKLFTAVVAVLALPRIASAQAPDAGESDDLEVPAGAATDPGASSTVTPEGDQPAAETPAPAPPATSEAAPSAPAVPSAAAPPPSGEPQPSAVVEPAAEIDRGAHSRPTPEGFVLGGYIQGEFQANAMSEDQVQQGGELLNSDRFLVRRARLRLDRTWDYASGSLELDANTLRGVTVGIRRAEASVFYRGENPEGAPPLAMLTLGATDLPFGFELSESARTRFFMERTLGSTALFPTEADVGLKLSGAAGFLRYAVAVTNGEPLSSSGWPRDPNAAKDVTGRLGVDVSAGKAFSIAGGTSFAIGKGFHRGQAATKDSLVWVDDDGNGLVSVAELIGVPGSAGSASENFDRWALGLDLELGFSTPLGRTRIYGEAFVAQNYDRGFADVDPVALGTDVRHAGAYGAIVQDVTRWAVVGVRASFYDPNSDVLESRKGKIVPKDQTVTHISPLAGFVLEGRARLLFQYDFVRDNLARDARGVPTDAKNDQFTARLQVEL